MSAATDLEKARELVKAGWIQGAATNPERSQFCALGALAEAQGRDPALDGPNRSRAWDCLLEARPKKAQGLSILVYNDKKTTKKADILRLFTRAIKIARGSR